MIIEIPEMIDLLEDFVNGYKASIIVGGMVGTEIEKFVLDAALSVTMDFSKILVLNGCQDYIGLMKKQLPNVRYWGDVFHQEFINSSIPYDPWSPKCMNPVPESVKALEIGELSKYEFLVVFNMHLISPWGLKQINDNFKGKIIFVCDPFEALVHEYTMITGQGDIPVICDTLRKGSPMIALARSIYDQTTRGIDTRVSGNVTDIRRFQRKTIINKTVSFRQYVTTDVGLYEEMLEKQKELPIRKNQTFMVNHDIINTMLDEFGNKIGTLTNKSMIVAQNLDLIPLKKFRIYNSKMIYFCDITYIKQPVTFSHLIPVIPANIIMLHDVMYHHFKHITVIADRPLTRAERYTLFKNSNNVSIVDKKNVKGVV